MSRRALLEAVRDGFQFAWPQYVPGHEADFDDVGIISQQGILGREPRLFARLNEMIREWINHFQMQG